MNDWKGKKVTITIWLDWTESVATVTTMLDTDTMLDIFSQFDPALYRFDIEPYEGDLFDE